MIVCLLAVAGCQEEETPPAPRPVVSEVLTLTPTNARSWVGTVQSRSEADLAFQVLGRVAERPVDVGDVVEEGDVVARLDTASLVAAERSAEAALGQAEARQRTARDALTRTRALFERKVASEANLEAAVQALAVARSEVDRARSALVQAADRRDNATLRASTHAVVTKTYVSPGATVSAGERVLRIARTDDLEAVIDLPEPAIATINKNAAFVVGLAAAPRVTADGRLAYIEPVAEAATRTRRVHITLDSPPPSFRLGSLVSASLKTGKDAVLSLPISAVFERDGQTTVWRVVRPENRVEAVTVELGQEFAERVRLTSGLSQGNEVVTRGVHSLQDGTIVGKRIGD
ncbi:hypothetical protein CH339_20315 [Rhodobium orientis]|uniref:Uncharacterized protein n=2 Tax=Rhodobium orientis TaxID=34017 RepID=A0A327JNI3_9HYPH|nr:efflux RND transporter periplasmic adaptor subunit [Rhodobium orientis]MBK5950856.1 hypothetical protein [Rhodobium orientis]RAI24978.1 hypothetical protein CH339_20315 [Rhodobium orientis]